MLIVTRRRQSKMDDRATDHSVNGKEETARKHDRRLCDRAF
jgi:hypothetical protein